MHRMVTACVALIALSMLATPAYGGDRPASVAKSARAHSVLGGRVPMSATSAYADDAEIPGLRIPASPINDSLTAGSDVDDVWAIDLVRGQSVSVTVTGDAGTDFDVFLFGPGTPTIFTSGGPLREADRSSYPDGFSFAADVTGTYYLDVYAYAGSGGYQLTYEIGPSAGGFPDDDSPGVAAPASPISDSLDEATDFDDVFALDLKAGQTLSARVSGSPGTDFDVYLYGPGTTTVIDSSDWLTCGATEAYPDGFTYVVRNSGTYYLDVWSYAGSGEYTLSYAIKSKPFVRTPIAPTKAIRSRYFSVYGWLKPAHPAGSYPVRIYKWRRTSSGAWKRHGYVNAVAQDHYGYTKYRRSIRLPYRGTWRLRAYAAEDASHTATWSSGYDYVTVR